MNWNIVRERLEHLIKVRDLNPTSLAALSGVPQPTIWRFLKGKNKTMTITRLQAIAVKLETTVSVLIGEQPLEMNENKRRVFIAMDNMEPYKVPGLVRVAEALAEQDDDGDISKKATK